MSRTQRGIDFDVAVPDGRQQTAMAKSLNSTIRKKGWLYKLVGKNPTDVKWKKYWVSGRKGIISSGCAQGSGHHSPAESRIKVL